MATSGAMRPASYSAAAASQSTAVIVALPQLARRFQMDLQHLTQPLKASFAINFNGEPLRIETVGQAYRFITNLSSVEWLEFWSLHCEAKAALEAAAENAMLCVQATNALRALFLRAKLL